MKKHLIVLILSLYSLCLIGQSSNIEKNGIKLTPVKDSPLFKGSSLKLNAPKNGQVQDSLIVAFSYTLENYQLTSQTADATTKHCSNSAKGQHIHLILNNEPYLAKYEADFSENLKAGNYVALSFLSRSYHESLKHKSAYQLTQFTIGEKIEKDQVDLKKPMLFYSRPKGEYIGEDTKKILLDFYIVNCSLSVKGYKVKATINGTEFIITDWAAYAMEGLPLGENTVSLELIDKDNKTVICGFNKVTRKITLK